MRKPLLALGLGLFALELVTVIGTAQVAPHPAPSPPPSLKSVKVPEPEHLDEFVKDKSAAVALGKALFWDMQVGSDGLTACASCHFQAGADSRVVNQLNPGANGAFDVGGPNHTFNPHEFPFHQLEDPENRKSARIRSKDDVGGSQGVHATGFNDVLLGAVRDDQSAGALDPLGFQVGMLNTRRVTGRNTPPSVNAVFNVRNFWDGRASRRFNGRNPFGDSDPDARVLRVNDLGEPEQVRISIDRASLASQAVGPPLSDVEMSAAGRTWMKLGKKMLTLQPLALQKVHPDDSVLGSLAVPGGKGLQTNYRDMIQAAFHEKWWASPAVVDAQMNVLAGVSAPQDGSWLPTDQYTVMEANFSMLWGLAILCYEATLVSDDSPYDRYAEGDHSALTEQQKFGLQLFLNSSSGNCIACHAGSEFTGASFSARLDPTTPDGMIERMIMGDKQSGVYDGGFYNIGVRPTAEDIGLGANDPFGKPLSLAQQEKDNPGSVQDNKIGPVGSSERVVKDGAFKTPSLRNVELTGPYFHNGSVASLRDVVTFYARGGNFRDENIGDLDPDIHRQRGLIGRPMRVLALTGFLASLTDERVRWQKAPFDHPELLLNVGAKGTELSVLEDPALTGQAQDDQHVLEATGAGGSSGPLRSFLDVPVFDATPIPAPNPVFSRLALFATDTVTVQTKEEVSGDIWSNGILNIAGSGPVAMHGDLVAGGDIRVTHDSTSVEGSLLARGAIQLPATFSVSHGIVADHVEHYAPLVMPSLPSVTAGSRALRFVKGFAGTLPAGKYGTVNIAKGAKVTLEPGQYVFQNLYMEGGAQLLYDPNGAPDPALGPEDEMSMEPTERTTLSVTGDLSLLAGSIITAGSPDRSNRFRMYAHSSTKPITFGKGSVFHGTLIAPDRKVTLYSGASFAGAIYGRVVEVLNGSSFRSHPHPDETTVPDLPGSAVVAGAAAPDVSLASNEESGPVGLAFAMAQNLPNPVKASTLIRFALPEKRDVRLEVFDVGGRSVRTIARGALPAGVHSLAWDRTSDRGKRLPSGVYLYRLVAGKDVAQRKMIVLD